MMHIGTNGPKVSHTTEISFTPNKIIFLAILRMGLNTRKLLRYVLQQSSPFCAKEINKQDIEPGTGCCWYQSI
jgi:hypothetical protein